MKYDLEDRLIDFAVQVFQLVEDLPNTRVGNHISGQLVRCSSSPAPNYGESQSAESRRDFIHKHRVCLKELRETNVWLKLVRKLGVSDAELVDRLKGECNQLISIFVTSIRTANTNASK